MPCSLALPVFLISFGPLFILFYWRLCLEKRGEEAVLFLFLVNFVARKMFWERQAQHNFTTTTGPLAKQDVAGMIGVYLVQVHVILTSILLGVLVLWQVKN